MADRIDEAQTKHVAGLASLSLTPEEVARATREIAAIVRYVDELATVDTSNVPPTSYVQLERPALRPDEPKPGLSHEDALSQAPRVAQDGFAVPAFVESE